ncbi:MAG: permease-like cell division protein FtsX [Pseudomonadales bacterium]
MSKGNTPEHKRGAEQVVIDKKARRRNSLQHHAQVGKDCLRQLFSANNSTLMTTLVLAVALAIPGFMFGALYNLERLGHSWEGEHKISLYLETSLSAEQVDSFSRQLLLRQDLIAVELIDASQGMIEFSKFSGLSQVLENLDANPLPAVIEVLARDTREESLTTLQQQLEALEQVEAAVIDLQWLKRFNAMLALAQRIAVVLSLLMGFAVLLIIGNTIRLNVASRRDEIEVSKLMGATDAWVRRPFLYTGMLYGLFAAAVAWLILSATLLLLAIPVQQLAQQYQSYFELAGPGWVGALVLLGVAMTLGFVAAWISVNKFLRQLRPR